MKILNEKGMIHFASSGVPADKEGYLHKKGEVNKGMQKRWFVLKGNLLFYYEKKGDKEPLGVIVLEGCTIELAEDYDNFMFLINFSSSGTRTYYLNAFSQESMESWMKALSCAGYEYMKLIVSELNNKLEETSSSAEAELVQAAFRDSQMLGAVYQNSNILRESQQSFSSNSSASSITHNKRVNPFDQQSYKPDRRDSHEHLFNFSNISDVNVVTWKIVEVNTFDEMHELMRQQIIELSNSPTLSS